MSNYLQFKNLGSAACVILLSIQTCITQPATSQQLLAQQKQEFHSSPPQQVWKFEKNRTGKFIDNPTEKLSANINENNQPPLAGLRDKLVRGIQGIVYDPVHPEQLLDKLIGGYAFYLFLHKQLISYGENLLGSENQMVIQAKQSYKAHVAYMEALKQQKHLLEQSKSYK